MTALKTAKSYDEAMNKLKHAEACKAYEKNYRHKIYVPMIKEHGEFDKQTLANLTWVVLTLAGIGLIVLHDVMHGSLNIF